MAKFWTDFFFGLGFGCGFLCAYGVLRLILWLVSMVLAGHPQLTV